MNNQQIVIEYTRLASKTKGVSDDAIYQSLCDKGFSAEISIQAVQIIPVAFGRHLLDGMGITFSEKFWVVDRMGKILQSGSFSENPIFVAALSLAPGLLNAAVSEDVVWRSAEVNCVNTALNAGSDPKNLALAPVAIFRGEPGAIGLRHVQETMSAHILELYKSKRPDSKTWWRFW